MAENKNYNIGEALYEQTFYFVDHGLLVNEDYQDRIKEYNFAKKFNCPPYPSISTTPPNIIDDFLAIDEEYSHCIERQQKENNNA